MVDKAKQGAPTPNGNTKHLGAASGTMETLSNDFLSNASLPQVIFASLTAIMATLVLAIWISKKFRKPGMSSEATETEKDPDGHDELRSQLKVPVKSVPAAALPLLTERGNSDWLILNHSATGLSHLAKNPPVVCQDSSHFAKLDNGWGVAVVSDGAGSYPLSHFGSRYVVKRAVEFFSLAIKNLKWSELAQLPSKEEWREKSIEIFRWLRNDLEKYCKESDFGNDPEVLSCTIITTVFTPVGIMLAHIGDGRACYRDEHGEWRALMEPFIGDNGEGTAFLPSDFVWSIRAASFIGTTVVSEPITAFALMTDGAERYAFVTQEYEPKKSRYIDPNLPFKPFLEKVMSEYIQLNLSGTPKGKMDSKWNDLLTNGKGFEKEDDDRTLLMGVLL